jgi:hypothetical protein
LPGPTFEIPRGLARDLLLQARDATDTALTTFTGSDTLACKLWPGDDQDPLATPTVAWSDVTTAKYLISFAAADTSSLAPGRYRLQVTFTRSSRTGLLLDAWLIVTATPGTSDPAASFVTYDDMRKYAPWLDDLAAESDQAGFLEQRARASKWLIDLLCDRWRPVTYDLGDRQYVGQWPLDQPSTWLRTKLEASTSALIVREKTREIVAKMAIAYVCDAQIGRDGSDNYLNLAAKFARDAGGLLRTYKAEVDTGATYSGTVGLVIDCGVGSLR